MPLDWLSWVWVLWRLIPARFVPSIVGLVHGWDLLLWDSWTKLTFIQFWDEWFPISWERGEGRLCGRSWLVLVFYVIVRLHSEHVLVSISISQIRWHGFILLTPNRLLTPSDMARLRLSLNQLRWLWESSSSPNCSRLVHFLLILELVIVLTLGLMVVEAAGSPSRPIDSHRRLDRIALSWIFRVLRLQSRHVSLLFNVHTNWDRGFVPIDGHSFLCWVYFSLILGSFANQIWVFTRFDFVPPSNLDLNSWRIVAKICTFHIALSLDSCCYV